MNPPTKNPAGTTLLALGLGAVIVWTLGTHDAVGYPAGSAVSAGSNPVVAQGGRLAFDGGSDTVFTAPADQNIMVTDVVLTGAVTTTDCYGATQVVLSTGSASNLANFSVAQRSFANSNAIGITAHYQGGLPVPAGETLVIHSIGNFRNCGYDHYHVDYSISGYLAQP